MTPLLKAEKLMETRFLKWIVLVVMAPGRSLLEWTESVVFFMAIALFVVRVGTFWLTLETSARSVMGMGGIRKSAKKMFASTLWQRWEIVHIYRESKVSDVIAGTGYGCLLNTWFVDIVMGLVIIIIARIDVVFALPKLWQWSRLLLEHSTKSAEPVAENLQWRAKADLWVWHFLMKSNNKWGEHSRTHLLLDKFYFDMVHSNHMIFPWKRLSAK
jgi:hypothetical protein